MPLDRTLERSRVQFHGRLGRRQVRALAEDREVEVLQCSRPVRDSTWDLLNEELFSRRHDILLRVYGFQPEEFEYGDA